MSTTRAGDRIIFECDQCGITHEGDRGEDFSAVWADAKFDGWRARKYGVDWVHACPDCEVER